MQTSPIQALQQQRLLLQLEYETEKETFRQQTQQTGIARKVKRGDAWWPVKVSKSYYNSLNQLAVELVRTTDNDIEHNFEFGRPVSFFHMDDGSTVIKHFRQTGTVSYVDGDRMVVTVPDGFPIIDLQNAARLGVQLSFDETSYRLMMEALDRAIKGKGRLGELRDLFYTPSRTSSSSSSGKSGAVSTFVFPPMHFPYLNATQENAVNMVLRAKDVAIVHGPPGTGKTTTLVEAIRETLMRESQVLVCAQSNMAVDWISEKLVDRGINVLRIGNPTRVTFRSPPRLSAPMGYSQGHSRLAQPPQTRRREIPPETGESEESRHGVGDTHQQRALWRGTRHRLDIGQFGQPTIGRSEVWHLVYRRGGTGTGSCLLDTHAARQPCRPGG